MTKENNPSFVKVLSWAALFLSLISTLISVLTYYSSETNTEIQTQIESERLFLEAADLLLFEPDEPRSLSWKFNYKRGQELTTEEDRQRLENARRKISNMEIIDPDNEDIDLLKLSYYIQFGDMESAAELMSEKVDKAERVMIWMFAAAFSANMKNSIESAIEYVNKAMKEEPSNPEIYRVYGVLLHTFGKNSEAIEQLKKARSIAPNSVVIIDDLAHVLVEVEQADKAASLLRGLVKKNMASARTYNTLGLIMFHKEDYMGAAEYFFQAVELMPKNGMFHKNLSLAYSNLGNMQDSKKHEELATQDKTLSVEILKSDSPWH